MKPYSDNFSLNLIILVIFDKVQWLISFNYAPAFGSRLQISIMNPTCGFSTNLNVLIHPPLPPFACPINHFHPCYFHLKIFKFHRNCQKLKPLVSSYCTLLYRPPFRFFCLGRNLQWFLHLAIYLSICSVSKAYIHR